MHGKTFFVPFKYELLFPSLRRNLTWQWHGNVKLFANELCCCFFFTSTLRCVLQYILFVRPFIYLHGRYFDKNYLILFCIMIFFTMSILWDIKLIWWNYLQSLFNNLKKRKKFTWQNHNFTKLLVKVTLQFFLVFDSKF